MGRKTYRTRNTHNVAFFAVSTFKMKKSSAEYKKIGEPDSVKNTEIKINFWHMLKIDDCHMSKTELNLN